MRPVTAMTGSGAWLPERRTRQMANSESASRALLRSAETGCVGWCVPANGGALATACDQIAIRRETRGTRRGRRPHGGSSRQAVLRRQSLRKALPIVSSSNVGRGRQQIGGLDGEPGTVPSMTVIPATPSRPDKMKWECVPAHETVRRVLHHRNKALITAGRADRSRSVNKPVSRALAPSRAGYRPR